MAFWYTHPNNVSQKVNHIFYDENPLNILFFDDIFVWGSGGSIKLKRAIMRSMPRYFHDLGNDITPPDNMNDFVSLTVAGLPYSVMKGSDYGTNMNSSLREVMNYSLMQINSLQVLDNNTRLTIATNAGTKDIGRSVLDYNSVYHDRLNKMVYIHFDHPTEGASALANSWNINLAPTGSSNIYRYTTPILADIYMNENSQLAFYRTNWSVTADSMGFHLFNAYYVEDMSYAFYLSGFNANAICGPNTTNMAYAFADTDTTGLAVASSNTLNMAGAYKNTNVKSFNMPYKVRNAYEAFYGCWNAASEYEISSVLDNMSYTYAFTHAGELLDIPNHHDQYNIIPDIPDTVRDMSYAFYCTEDWLLYHGGGLANIGQYIKGGRNVKNYSHAYSNTSANYILQIRTQEKGSMFESAVNMAYAFSNTSGLHGDLLLNYMNLNNLDDESMYVDGSNMLAGKAQYGRLNIYVPPDGTIASTNESPYWIQGQGWRSWNSYLWSHPQQIFNNVAAGWTLDAPNNCYYEPNMSVYVYYTSTPPGGSDISIIKLVMNEVSSGEAGLMNSVSVKSE